MRWVGKAWVLRLTGWSKPLKSQAGEKAFGSGYTMVSPPSDGLHWGFVIERPLLQIALGAVEQGITGQCTLFSLMRWVGKGRVLNSSALCRTCYTSGLTQQQQQQGSNLPRRQDQQQQLAGRQNGAGMCSRSNCRLLPKARVLHFQPICQRIGLVNFRGVELLHVDMSAHNKSGIAYRDGNRRSFWRQS
jgi:hypothetical protein